ncbi:MAG TPA: peptidylprolyl isomerase [Bryobacteraceae bacterium]|nr:peptidylprolyl isomerase [Bryobacteraceae bacterium]
MRIAALILIALALCGCSKHTPEAAASDERAPDSYKVQFDTSKGQFVVAVTRGWAPLGADRFYTLVKSGFYDGARFFRVRPGFVVQFGIAGDPAVNAKWRNANLQDDPVAQSNRPGTITYAAERSPNTRSTQVFINLADNVRLDATRFAPFGAVTQGMDVVSQFYSDYGEIRPMGTGPDEGRAEAEGNAYFVREFPRLDYIKNATIEK